jgi:hypothetical protein
MIASHGGADTYPISTATPISGALLTDQYHWVAASVFAGVCIISLSLKYVIAVLTLKNNHS